LIQSLRGMSSPKFSLAQAIHALAVLGAAAGLLACDGRLPSRPSLVDRSTSAPSAYPQAVDLKSVGTYPGEKKSRAGYFYDDVLEYRVWFYPQGAGDDRYAAFAQYEQASAFSKATPNAEAPLVLVRQRQWIDEPEPGHYVPESGERLTDWQVQWLSGNKRTSDSITEFMKHPKPARTN
jgi:hypothetical protein